MVSLVLKIIVITFVIEGLGGIGFIVNLEVLEYPKTKRLSLHTRLVLTVTALLIVVGTLIILLLEWSNPATLRPLSPEGKFLASYFQAVTPRTAGFNSSISQICTGHIVFYYFADVYWSFTRVDRGRDQNNDLCLDPTCGMGDDSRIQKRFYLPPPDSGRTDL